MLGAGLVSTTSTPWVQAPARRYSRSPRWSPGRSAARFSDRVGPKVISLISLAGIVSLAYIVGQQPPEGILTGVTFILMAAAMGLGMGAVFAWIGPSTPKDKVGAVTGVVAAAGGLGGDFPPLVMGATCNAETNSYALGLWLLVIVGAAALVVAGMLRDARPGAKV